MVRVAKKTWGLQLRKVVVKAKGGLRKIMVKEGGGGLRRQKKKKSYTVSKQFIVEKQIEFSCIDIKPDAVKIGMLHSTKVILSVIKLISISTTKNII